MTKLHRRLVFCVGSLLVWVYGGPRVAAQASHTAHEVSFSNDSVVLSGTFMIPSTEGSHPAVVFLHGSGPSTREGARPYAEEFASLGIASLFFDKRGCGKSGGSWITASLDDLSNDALAAMEFLKKQEGIDSARIGLWGVSQAGWVATVAAAKSRDVAFLILISGGGVSPYESELFSYKQEFEKAGLSESDDSTAYRILDIYFNYLRNGEGRKHLVAALDTIRTGNLKALAEQLSRITPSEANRHNWSWVGTYDPESDIAKITCPILLMFGDRDRQQPTDLAVKRWKEGLKKAGNNDVTIMLFPGAGHGIRMGDHKDHIRAPFADGYKEAQLGWLWRHVVQGQ